MGRLRSLQYEPGAHKRQIRLITPLVAFALMAYQVRDLALLKGDCSIGSAPGKFQLSGLEATLGVDKLFADRCPCFVGLCHSC